MTLHPMFKLRLPALAAAGALLFFCAAVSGSDSSWIEVQSPHFRVLSDSPEGSARNIAREFEQMRALFGALMPGMRPDSGVPIVVVAAFDEGMAKNLLPEVWKAKGFKPAGIFNGGSEKDFAFVRMDVIRRESNSQVASAGGQVVYHEYTHSLLHANYSWLPLWFDEGFAEFCSYTRFLPDRVVVGAPSARLTYYRRKFPIPLERFLTLTRSSSEYRDEPSAQVFYAEAWGLVHFLMVSPQMEKGQRLQKYLGLLHKGTDEKQAFREAIGEFQDIETQLDAWMRQFSLPAFSVKNFPIADRDFTIRHLKPSEANAELATFQIWMREKDAARERVGRALNDDNDSALGHQASAFIHFANGEDEAASNEFERALQLDGKLYLSAYYKTMLSPIAVSDRREDRETSGLQ